MPELLTKSKAVAAELAVVIQETDDPSRLEELLGINDKLLSLLKKVPVIAKPNLKLHGLGLAYTGSQSSSEDGDGTLDGLPNINGRMNALDLDSDSNSVTSFEDDADLPTPTTPKIDKGKRRAEPEPEEPEMVLSPNISKMNGGSEEDGILYPENVASPTDRYVDATFLHLAF